MKEAIDLAITRLGDDDLGIQKMSLGINHQIYMFSLIFLIFFNLIQII